MLPGDGPHIIQLKRPLDRSALIDVDKFSASNGGVSIAVSERCHGENNIFGVVRSISDSMVTVVEPIQEATKCSPRRR